MSDERVAPDAARQLGFPGGDSDSDAYRVGDDGRVEIPALATRGDQFPTRSSKKGSSYWTRRDSTPSGPNPN